MIVHRLLLRATAAYLRTFQWDIARWRLVRYAVRLARTHGPSMGMATVSTRFGFKMELRLDDWVDQHIYATGLYEDFSASTIAALLSPGDGCVDLGANIGFFTLLMASCVGPHGSVWAFEPCPPTRERLVRNVRLNALSHVTVREEAVSNVDGESEFFGGTGNHSGIASLRPVSSTDVYKVRTCRLSKCLPANMKVRLIKMDVEGAEQVALLGMMDLLRDQQPDIVLEMSDEFLKEMGSSSAEMYNLLQQCGYRMYQIDWDGLIAHERWSESLPTQFNALFTVRDALPKQLNVK